MCYTVGVVDRAGAIATVFLNPDRPARVVADAIATNHQPIGPIGPIDQPVLEWPEHAKLTGTVERHAVLARVLADPSESLGSLIQRFLAAPLHAHDHARRFATLYTAAYYPARGEVELHWQTVAVAL